MTTRAQIIHKVFRDNCVDYAGNYEVTPGGAIVIANKIQVLSGLTPLMREMAHFATITAETNAPKDIRERANDALDHIYLCPIPGMDVLNPKHMSASDMLQQCNASDIVELVDRLCGNTLDRDKLKAKVEALRSTLP